eukprot:1194856-Prorocentrum_minimum.AAC.4
MDAALEELTLQGFALPPDAHATKESIKQNKAMMMRAGEVGELGEALEAATRSRDAEAIQAALDRSLAAVSAKAPHRSNHLTYRRSIDCTSIRAPVSVSGLNRPTVGLEGEAVSRATQFLATQGQKKADMSALMAACRTLELKMCSTGGIDKSELDVVHKCISALVKYEFTSDETDQITEAQQILRKGMQVGDDASGRRATRVSSCRAVVTEGGGRAGGRVVDERVSCLT